MDSGTKKGIPGRHPLHGGTPHCTDDTWGSVLVADGKLYVGNQRDFRVLAASTEPKLLSETRLGSAIYGTPIVADGVLYVVSQRYLWAVKAEAAVAGGGE